jgi:DNA polymerase I-like protein with 3'-5' exonuclease and polymerase domains
MSKKTGKSEGQGILPLHDDPKATPPDPFPSLDGIHVVGFDTETTGLRWWGIDRPVGIAIAWREGTELKSAYLPWAHKGGGNHPKGTVSEWARRVLRGKHLVGLNLKFDMHMMRALGLDLTEQGNTFNDVGHNAALLDDHMKPGDFGLEAIAQKTLGEGKLDAGDPAEIWQKPAWMIAPYARKDAELALRVYERQRPEMERQELIKVSDLEDSVIPAACEMEWNGALIDVEKLHGWDRDSQRALEAKLMQLRAVAGFHVHPSSSGDLTRLFGQLGIRSPLFTDGGERGVPQPSYTDAVLAGFTEHEAIRLLRSAAHLEDLRAKFITPYTKSVGSDGILRFSLNQLRSEYGGTVSGRFSSSKPSPDEGANVQQVMSGEKQLKMHCGLCKTGDYLEHFAEEHPQVYLIRELFIPSPGMLLLGSDAKQIEYRVFAHMSGSKRILDAYAQNPNVDYHQIVCDMVQAHRAGFSRKDSKNLSFAILFGAGIKKVAEMLGVDVSVAKAMRDAYFSAFPEAKAIMELAVKTATTRGYVKTWFGRRTRFHRCPEHGFAGSRKPCFTCPRVHKALNAAIQGSAADINKLKLAELYAERKRLSLKPRMTIHDEVVADVEDDSHADLVAAQLDSQSIPMRVPILWQTRTAKNWLGCK